MATFIQGKSVRNTRWSPIPITCVDETVTTKEIGFASATSDPACDCNMGNTWCFMVTICEGTGKPKLLGGFANWLSADAFASKLAYPHNRYSMTKQPSWPRSEPTSHGFAWVAKPSKRRELNTMTQYSLELYSRSKSTNWEFVLKRTVPLSADNVVLKGKYFLVKNYNELFSHDGQPIGFNGMSKYKRILKLV